MKQAVVLCALLMAGCAAYKSEDERRIENAQAAVAAVLRDPESAQFREIIVSEGVVCGQINGTNAFGGYTGFAKFYYDGSARLAPTGDLGSEYDRDRIAVWLHEYEKHCGPYL